MKPFNTIRQQLVRPKDQTPKEKQSGVIYQLSCDQDSKHTYIGETKRTFATRFKEHKDLNRPTAVGEHTLATGHTVSMETAKIIGKDPHFYSRKIKEAVKIRTQRPLLNRDGGVQLPPLYDDLLIRRQTAGKASFIDKSQADLAETSEHL